MSSSIIDGLCKGKEGGKGRGSGSTVGRDEGGGGETKPVFEAVLAW